MSTESDELQELLDRYGFKAGTFCFRHDLRHPASENPWPRVNGWISRSRLFCLDEGDPFRPGWVITHRWSGYRVGKPHEDARNAIAFIVDLECATFPDDWLFASRGNLSKNGLFIIAQAIRKGYP